ncbi:hypothetical protein H9P43_000163 [Blastocladiella emersonii ATCC 22665]|nr:hypothetical protein H9P43_000163 [Blastocladiella emersonii ATCC 22665]
MEAVLVVPKSNTDVEPVIKATKREFARVKLDSLLRDVSKPPSNNLWVWFASLRMDLPDLGEECLTPEVLDRFDAYLPVAMELDGDADPASAADDVTFEAKLARVQATFGPKLHAVVRELKTATERTAIFCQSPVLAAHVASAIAAGGILAVDAASPDPRLRNAAISIFERELEIKAIVCSLNADDGTAAAAPPYRGQLPSAKNVFFVHPLIAESDKDGQVLIERALGLCGYDSPVTWFVATDTVEEELMRPIAAKYIDLGLPDELAAIDTVTEWMNSNETKFDQPGMPNVLNLYGQGKKSETVFYRLQQEPDLAAPLDYTRKYTHRDFTDVLAADPYYNERQRSSASIMNIFTLAADAVFAESCLEPARRAYPLFGHTYCYQVWVFLRTSAVNRDLANPETTAQAQRAVRQILHAFPSNLQARMFTAVDRIRREPYFRLGPHGFVHNFLTGDFAPTCPPEWILPAITQPFETMEIRGAFVQSDDRSEDLYAELLAHSPVSINGDGSNEALVSTAVFVVTRSNDEVELVVQAAKREFGPAARVLAVRNAVEYRAATWAALVKADVPTTASLARVAALVSHHRLAAHLDTPAGDVTFDSELYQGSKLHVTEPWIWFASLDLDVDLLGFSVEHMHPTALSNASTQLRTVPGHGLEHTHPDGVHFLSLLLTFFRWAQAVTEFYTALDPAGELDIQFPASRASRAGSAVDYTVEFARVKASFGPKLHAVVRELKAAAGRTAIFCQSPVLAAYVASAIAAGGILAVDAASPDARLRSAAISIFERELEIKAVVCSLNGEDGTAATAPPHRGQLASAKNVFFVHPLVAESDEDAQELIQRALAVCSYDSPVTWFVAKDTVEKELMRPIAAKYVHLD